MAAKKKSAPPPTPTVLGVRYCLACGKACLTVALGVSSVVAMQAVGAAMSTCCSAHTALVLLPTTAPTARAPRALPALVGSVPARPEDEA